MKSFVTAFSLVAVLASGNAAAADKSIAGAMAPSVVADGKGGFTLSWVDTKSKAFRFAQLSGDRWGDTRTIRENVFANRADFPTMAVRGDAMTAHYSLKKGAHGRNVYVVRSTDGGRSWSKETSPHPALVSEFGFVSLLPTGEMIWLDGRDLPGGHEGAGDMGLHFSARGTDDQTIDPRVCDCCQTAMAMTSAGPIVAYRDRSADEVRDISIVRRTASGWTAPQPLHRDGWKIKGCPVNGPQLDARGRDVAATWFTAPGKESLVYLAFSRNDGATFGKPVQINTGKTTGKVDVVLARDGAIVSWVEGTTLFARHARFDGKVGKPVSLGEVTGFPRLAISENRLAVAAATADGVRFTIVPMEKF